VLGKNDYVGMDYVGVRAHESVTRADYDYENYGKKQKGQYSHNSILEWSSAEIWMYIYANNLIINKALRRGILVLVAFFAQWVAVKVMLSKDYAIKKKLTASLTSLRVPMLVT
jgi:3'-phosphoadenosine 5'-phosphosulfate sulfotransferase (PAPS reductase)/FAD synthetase